MRLHTNLSSRQLHEALNAAKAAGHVTPDVRFVNLEEHGSQTHARAFEVQLGTYDKYSLPAGYRDQNGHRLNVRRYKNSGGSGAASGWYGPPAVWSATWHEWGWFIAAVFAADPPARWGAVKGWGYRDEADFNRKTKNQFRDDSMTFPKGYSV